MRVPPVDEDILDKIGPWSEVKLEIIRKYAKAYSQIFANRPGLAHLYIDAFAGAGRHISKRSGELVPGSPAIALDIEPPFREYHFIDIDGLKIQLLEDLAKQRKSVVVHHGDCNVVIQNELLALLRYDQFKRGLSILDPYGMDLKWSTVDGLAKTGTTDVFINFPVMDINRNALRVDPDKISSDQSARMTSFWGGDTWQNEFYAKQAQIPLWGDPKVEKNSDNDQVVSAYVKRLKEVAGFRFVASPMPMRNSANAVVYYLLFASHKPVAQKIVEEIISKYR